MYELENLNGKRTGVFHAKDLKQWAKLTLSFENASKNYFQNCVAFLITVLMYYLFIYLFLFVLHEFIIYFIVLFIDLYCVLIVVN